MKRKFFLYLTLAGILGSVQLPAMAAETEGQYVIGVPVYDLNDDQVMAFRDYLENYIGVQFENVEFLYSQSIHSAEEEMAFIQDCIDYGADGILAFNSYDLKAEVELCSSNGVYYLKPSSTPSKEDFDLVADDPYFLGYFGPGTQMEYQAGAEMAQWFTKQDFGKNYVIFSGGASLGNAMHKERTMGILDEIEAAAGSKFEISTEELACSSEPVTVTAGEYTVTICGGYIAMEPFTETAREVLKETEKKDVILSVIPPASLTEEFKGAKVGIIDCYTATNSELYANGNLQYLCGKYSSIIGPAFAAMYNALTGYAEDFREDGKAFSIIQGFWTSEDAEDFNKKYELSAGIAKNAYSYSDILEVIKEHNPEATLDDLRELGESWEYEAALERTEQEK